MTERAARHWYRAHHGGCGDARAGKGAPTPQPSRSRRDSLRDRRRGYPDGRPRQRGAPNRAGRHHDSYSGRHLPRNHQHGRPADETPRGLFTARAGSSAALTSRLPHRAAASGLRARFSPTTRVWQDLRLFNWWTTTRKRFAAAASSFAASRSSIVWPVESTARYRYRSWLLDFAIFPLNFLL